MCGSVAPNQGGVWFHCDPSGNVIDVHLAGWHFQPVTGDAWIKPPPMTLGGYTMLHAAAWTSVGAFETVISSGPWAAYYNQTLPPGTDRELCRRFVASQPPLLKVDPPIPG